MTQPARIGFFVAPGDSDNDNQDPCSPADVEELGVAAQSALWHTRTYGELLRPRLNVLAGDTTPHARALATQLAECIGCRRSIRCEVCPVAKAAGRF